MKFKNLIFISQLIVSGLALFYVLWILDIELIRNSFRSLEAHAILFSFFFSFLTLYLIAIRWTYIVEYRDKARYSLAKNAHLSSNLYNLITPANLGGDAYKFIYFKEEKPLKITLKIILERIYGVIVLLSLTTFCFLQVKENLNLELVGTFGLPLLPMFLFLIACIAILISIFKETVIDSLKEIKCFIDKGLGTQLFILFYSFMNLITWSLSIYVLNLSFGINASYMEILFVCMVVELIRYIPISFQGIGIRESSFVLFMVGFGYEPETSFSLALISYAILTMSTLLLGLLGSYNLK